MAEILSKQDVQDVIEVIKQLYLEDRIPWICGYSGGKDSTAIVQLVWMALRQIPKEKRVKTVHVISTDTMVESPVVAVWSSQSLKKMEEAADIFHRIVGFDRIKKHIPHLVVPTQIGNLPYHFIFCHMYSSVF